MSSANSSPLTVEPEKWFVWLSQSLLPVCGTPGEARQEARLWLQAYLGDNWKQELAASPQAMKPSMLLRLRHALWLRKTVRLPLQYGTAEAAFRALLLEVTPAVLIPRPETEHLVDFVVQALQQQARQKDGLADSQPLQWLEVGTGSGAIVLSLAQEIAKGKHLPLKPEQLKLYACDVSEKALAVAQRNTQNLQLEDTITFFQSNLLENVAMVIEGKLDGLVANLPYIDKEEAATLQAEVGLHEPAMALFAEEAGCLVINTLLEQALDYLKPGASVWLETAANNAQLIARYAKSLGYQGVTVYTDWSGLPRFVTAQYV